MHSNFISISIYKRNIHISEDHPTKETTNDANKMIKRSKRPEEIIPRAKHKMYTKTNKHTTEAYTRREIPKGQKTKTKTKQNSFVVCL